ncbi:MAG: formate dehydrogenase accessory sulfurtransferase FdhD [Candidatus Dormibacteraeota bacterium]|nr:formate dehydrogenase accessory sulfurtransferase FdhD [Candidatus Dormibacteraeota bacterium]
MARSAAVTTSVLSWAAGGFKDGPDALAAEEPLQILLDGRPLSVVMRTPGQDVELALGLLFAERVITARGDVREVGVSVESGEPDATGAVTGLVLADLVESNAVDVRLAVPPGRDVQRSLLSSSACGVCGATTIESLALDAAVVAPGLRLAASVLVELPARLRAGQELFGRTGGLHAAGLFTTAGDSVLLREDVGRHNAVDKVVGRRLLEALLPLDGHVLVVSGRGGYEIVAKAAVAGIPVVACVGAPSSLAVETARRFGIGLAGFLRAGRFNVYAGAERFSP